jgi:hypothetical protein
LEFVDHRLQWSSGSSGTLRKCTQLEVNRAYPPDDTREAINCAGSFVPIVIERPRSSQKELVAVINENLFISPQQLITRQVQRSHVVSKYLLLLLTTRSPFQEDWSNKLLGKKGRGPASETCEKGQKTGDDRMRRS